ncbi:MAG TPA: hypothetical protein VFV87_06345 [Pirellulaceae bacterium]|nr:hypothetical protein [Pirellulaceae bacterium]
MSPSRDARESRWGSADGGARSTGSSSLQVAVESFASNNCGMSSTANELRVLVANPPTDLVVHFDAVTEMHEHRQFLNLAAAVAMSQTFREFHPLATALGLVFLDDANTSNYHAYITIGPLASAILYLSHDGDTRAVFPALADYRADLQAAYEEGEYSFDAHDEPPIQARDQAALTARIAQLIEEDEEAELLVLLASWNASSEIELKQLVRHPNFFVAEANGNTIARLARPELLPFANILTGHPHSQAANAGKRAMAAIQGTEKRNP